MGQHDAPAAVQGPHRPPPDWEAGLQSAVGQLPMILWGTDNNLSITFSRGGGLARLDLRPDQLVGITVPAYLGGVEPDHPVLAAHRQALRGEPITYEVDWQGRSYLAHLEPLRATDGVTGCLGIALDLTERRQAEDALKRSEERFRRVFEHATVGLGVLSPAGHFVQVNPALAALTGYTEAELLGTSMLAITHPDDRGRNQALLQQLLAGEVSSYQIEKRYLRKGGGSASVRIDASLVRNAAGQPAQVVGIIQDVTEQRKLERQFLQAQKMEAVGRLAGGVAHDFNNLLTIINGYAELLLRNFAPHRAAVEMLRQMQEAGERAAALTRQLLAFSRQQVLALKTVYLDRVVHETERMLRRLIGEDIELITLSGDKVGAVLADPVQIQQVLLNLVVNARDAMPRGGKLVIETRNVELDAAFALGRAEIRPGPYVMLAVSDTGAGMDEATQARIFEPFFTTKEQGRGTGLGLATVYGIVKQSEGYIYVYSELGRGTTFKVYLPRIDPATEPAERPAPPPPSKGPRGGETLLVVEDEQAVRELICSVLKGQGYTVLAAPDGEEALRLCREHGGPIDLVVSDVVMPRLGGRQLADGLAALRPGVKILFLSGYTDDAVVRHGVLEAETAFLQKPFTPAGLAHKVREVLDQ